VFTLLIGFARISESSPGPVGGATAPLCTPPHGDANESSPKETSTFHKFHVAFQQKNFKGARQDQGCYRLLVFFWRMLSLRSQEQESSSAEWSAWSLPGNDLGPSERIPIRTNIQNIAHYCDSSVKGSKTSVQLLMNPFSPGEKLNSVNLISDESPEIRRPSGRTYMIWIFVHYLVN